MTIVELAPPPAEPLTLAEARAHLRLDQTAEDGLVASLIRAVRLHLERETGLALISRPFRLYLDAWPQGRVLEIARGPVRSIEAMTVYKADGLPAAVNLTGFTLDGRARPARLFLPAVPATEKAINGIEIDLTAGFGDTGTDAPETLRRAMLLHLTQLFAFRGAVAVEDQPAAVPAGYDRLIAPFRLRRIA
ncbi:hypothetical protein ACLE20_00330 [Rhizobium sp. YIM 134829]|uniref:head-tail connector protein n=1 Tax=Rhizobium sp. YIM 134829 TaxID=3390453 RepID=UPI0039799D9E